MKPSPPYSTQNYSIILERTYILYFIFIFIYLFPISYSSHSLFLLFPASATNYIFCLYGFTYSHISHIKRGHTIYVTFHLLLSLTRMILNFIHVVTCIRTSFIMAEECSIGIWIHHILFIHLSQEHI